MVRADSGAAMEKGHLEKVEKGISAGKKVRADTRADTVVGKAAVIGGRREPEEKENNPDFSEKAAEKEKGIRDVVSNVTESDIKLGNVTLWNNRITMENKPNNNNKPITIVEECLMRMTG